MKLYEVGIAAWLVVKISLGDGPTSQLVELAPPEPKLGETPLLPPEKIMPGIPPVPGIEVYRPAVGILLMN
jgi:hypothetical protein